MQFKDIQSIKKQRIFHHALAVIGTAYITIVTILLLINGHLLLSTNETIVFLTVYCVGSLMFTCIFFTKIDDQIKTASLVLPHMMWGQIWVLFLAYHSPTMHHISLMLSATTFVFVSFGLSSIRVFLSVLIVAIGHSYIALKYPFGRSTLELALIISTYTASSIFIAAVNSYFGNLRIHLSDQNTIIQNRTTELEIAQAQLTEAKEQAESAVASKTHFLAAASHDLRQPLYALELYIGALTRQDSELVRQHIFSQMEKSANELNSLLSSLFDISRFDTNVAKVNIACVKLADIVEDLELEFSELSEKMKVPLKVRTSNAVVSSDAIMVHRIIRALVTNALKHANKGKVLVVFRTRGDAIRCEVWDSGQGISKAEQTRIFEEFYQVGNAHRDRQQGLGLGLALVKRMCRALNHDFGMRSVLGKGTVFWFEMKKSALPKLPKPVQSLDLDPLSLQGRTVLCIDDEETILEGMVLLLENFGCHAIPARSPGDAIKRFQGTTKLPDIIVCDYRLANHINGIDAIKVILNHLQKDIPALLVTGDIDPNIRTKAQASNIKVLQKPLNPAKLRLHIFNTLKGNHILSV